MGTDTRSLVYGRLAFVQGLAKLVKGDNILEYVKSEMYGAKCCEKKAKPLKTNTKKAL